jgi:hypothetical protein
MWTTYDSAPDASSLYSSSASVSLREGFERLTVS